MSAKDVARGLGESRVTVAYSVLTAQSRVHLRKLGLVTTLGDHDPKRTFAKFAGHIMIALCHGT